MRTLCTNVLLMLAVCATVPNIAHADIFDGMTNTFYGGGFGDGFDYYGWALTEKDGIMRVSVSTALDYRITSSWEQCYVFYCQGGSTGNIQPDSTITLTLMADDWTTTYTFDGHVHSGSFNYSWSENINGQYDSESEFSYFFSGEGIGDHWLSYGTGYDIYSNDVFFQANVSTVTQAPESSTITFLGLGLAGLYSRMRRYL